MTPLSFEWHWNIEYIIFMGLLYIALSLIGCGLIFTYIKTWWDLSSGEKKEDDSPPEISSRSKYSKY